MPSAPETLAALSNRCGQLPTSEFRGQTRVVASKDQLLEVVTLLKGERRFDLLVDVTCVDCLNFRDAADRFGLVYLLANTETGERITVRVFVNEPDLAVPSLYDLYRGADWLEREVFDLFGITFTGHPDLRRILMPDEFTAFPLRKDYPLQGRGERHNFPVLARRDA
jgi:NADH-quinone oxidoreductase subunit C